MAGYLGSKAVLLSTTAASVTGNATIGGELSADTGQFDTSLNVDGTITSDGLTVEGSGYSSLKRTGTINSDAVFDLRSDNGVVFRGSKNGDISFYEDTGTTAKFVWKSADERLGIGVSSPAHLVDAISTSGSASARFGSTYAVGANNGTLIISNGGTGNGMLRFDYETSTDRARIGVTTSSQDLQFFTAGDNERMRIDSSGNVGIGDADPLDKLEVKTTTLGGITISSPTHNYAALSFARSSTATARIFISEPGALHTSAIHLQTSNASGGPNLITAMTIDQNQNVGIGTSSPSETLDVSGNIRALGANSRVMFGPDGFEAGIKYATDASLQIASRTGENITFNNGNDGSERMRIRSDGIVTINDSTDPTAGGFAPKLHVKQGGDGIFGGFTIEGHNSDVVGGMGYSASSDTFGIGASYRSTAGFKPLAFLTSNSERLRIDTSGNTLFGKTSVSWTLDGTQIENGGETLGVTSSLTGNNFFARKNNATGTMFAFWYNSTNIGNITSGTSSVAYNTSSDYRLKENVTDVTDGITRIKQLAPKRFNFIADPDTTVDGFIAHEAQAVVPEAVTGTHNAVDADGNPEYQGIDQSKLVPLLTAALQEAIAKIETLETEMTSVKARLDALEAE